MKIAVTSQNKREITEHAGRCRKFWIYEVNEGKIDKKSLLELPKEQAFHNSSPNEPHPLDDVQVFLTGSMGRGLIQRLEAKSIEPIITKEKEPERAVAAYLDGTLEQVPYEHHHHVGHEH